MNMFDASKYRINVALIKSTLENKTEEERLEHIGRLSLMTGVPIVVVVFYMLELFGSSPALENKFTRFKKFYDVETV